MFVSVSDAKDSLAESVLLELCAFYDSIQVIYIWWDFRALLTIQELCYDKDFHKGFN